MVRHRDISLGAGNLRLVDDLLEAAPGGVAQQLLQFARQPVLGAFLGVDRAFKALVQTGDEFLLHLRVPAVHRGFLDWPQLLGRYSPLRSEERRVWKGGVRTGKT